MSPKTKIMKRILQKIPQPLRGIIGLCHLTAIIYCLCIWPVETILFFIVEDKLQKHWKIALLIVMTSIVTMVGGAALRFAIGLLFGWSYEACVIGSMFAGIYVLGLIIEPDNHKPYIWLWKQGKKLFQKKQNLIIIN